MKHWLKSAVLATVIGTMASASFAAYPERQITMIVPFSAGGSTDVLARGLADRMGELLGESIVVSNQPGAGGIVGVAAAANSPADGYTLLFMTNSLVINAAINDNLPYNTLEDLQPISLVGDFPNVLVVHPSLEVDSLQELIELSQSSPVQYASSGSGNYLASELFLDTTGLKAERIPYSGAGDAVPAVVGGEVPVMLTGVINVLPHLETKSLIPLVVTSETRLDQLPDIPSITEAGIESSDDAVWYGLLAPGGVPDEVVEALHTALTEALADETLRDRFEALTLRISTNTPDEFRALIDADITRWTNLIKEKGLSVN